MANCPVCGNSLGDDFGLVDCGQCGVGLFIEFDGTVRRREEDSTPPLAQSTPPPLEPSALSDALDSEQSQILDLGEPEIPSTERLVNPTEVTGSDVEEVPFELAPPMVMSEEPPSANPLAEITEFGNSSASSSQDGAYHYDLLISGIDSSEIRNAVKEVLSDQFFIWDVEPLLRSILQGELKLSQVSSAKAALVVQRLSGLPVRVKWVQHALLLLLFISLPAMGSGGGGGEAPPSEEGAPAAPVNKEQIEYSKKEARLNTLRSRIEESNTSFAKTVEAKNHSKDPKHQRELAETLAAIAKERNKWVSEYTELRQELRYRYPNQGKEIDKKFAPNREKTAAELENSAEIDMQLTALKHKIEKKYAPFMPKEEAEAAPISSPTPNPEAAPKKLRLVK